VGAAIAAELGTMKVTEQLDALYTLGTNPFRFLAVPVYRLPDLYLDPDPGGGRDRSDGRLLVAIYRLGIPRATYIQEMPDTDLERRNTRHRPNRSSFGDYRDYLLLQGLTCEGGAEGLASDHQRGRDLDGPGDGDGLLLSALLVAFGSADVDPDRHGHKSFGPNHVLRGAHWK